MDSKNHDQHQLHIFFLPFIQPGHMIPMIDVARLFATRPGVKVSIITTTHNALLFKTDIDQDIKVHGSQIQLHILEFPSEQVGLPKGIENFKSATSKEMYIKIGHGITILQQPIEQLLRDNNPDCIISDAFYPWTADLALELGCPRIAFVVTGFFSHCVMESIWRHKPHEKVSTDTESFIIPELPDKVEMTRLQLPDHVRTRNPYSCLQDIIKDAELRSYGNIMNSFYELEPSYADHFRNFMGRKAWQLGPVSLSIKRETTTTTEMKHECLSWLDSMKPNSVVYVSFGSLVRFSKAQLLEIGFALQASGHPFIWVVKEPESSTTSEDEAEAEADEEKWLPEELKKKGMIITGWAPQVAILDHPSIGGFVTHCGWNSVLESVSAGVPMIVWPLYAEQFYNEKLVVEVLKIGVGVGAQEFHLLMQKPKVLVKRKMIKNAVTWLMDCAEEPEDMRQRVKKLSEMAKRAVEERGSSYTSLSDLIEELKILRSTSNSSSSSNSRAVTALTAGAAEKQRLIMFGPPPS